MKKILFISHEASLSGAPVLALQILKMLSQVRSNYTIDVLLIRGGALYEDFAKISNEITVANNQLYSLSFVKRNLKRVQSILFKNKENNTNKITKITDVLLPKNYDLVYGNTMESLQWTLPFFYKKIPTIVAIHELTFGVESTYPKAFVLENINNTTKIIAGSQAVADNLIKRYNAKVDQVEVIHSFVEDNMIISREPVDIKKELHIKQDELIVGIASSQELRKGTELIPMLVQKIKQKTTLPFKFVNLGGTLQSGTVRCAKIDAENLEVSEDLLFVEHKKNSNDYINIYDVFVLMSREDPFPLVMLTAAKLKKPIVAFEKSGGAVEFLNNDCGLLASYLDLDDMATKIVHLLDNENLRKQYGEKINQKLQADFSEKKLTAKILTVIDDLVQN